MWSAELTNNPEQEYLLYIELLEDDVYRGRIELDGEGQPILRIYPTESGTFIPGNWLKDILAKAREELSQV